MNGPEMLGDILGATIDRLDTSLRFPVVRTSRTEGRAPIDKGTRRLVHERDRWRCQWCNRHWTEMQLQVDHIIPWSAGGSDDIENLRTLCADCNSKRSNYDADTVQRRPPIACGCAECDPEWFEENSGEYIPSPVYCVHCHQVGLGGSAVES